MPPEIQIDPSSAEEKMSGNKQNMNSDDIAFLRSIFSDVADSHFRKYFNTYCSSITYLLIVSHFSVLIYFLKYLLISEVCKK